MIKFDEPAKAFRMLKEEKRVESLFLLSISRMHLSVMEV